MTILKLLLATTAVFFTTGLGLIKPCCKNPGEPLRVVQEHYQTHARRLQSYYASLSAALKVDAPDLLPMLEPPEPLQHGYQILPKIVADTPSPGRRPRAESSGYSWPWTGQLIDSGLKEIIRSEKELDRAGALSLTARRSAYEKLARRYREIRARQQNIDAHIQYNRLWQAAIAANRSGYDRETVLHNAVLERQAILDALNAIDGAAFKKAPAGINRIDSPRSLAETMIGLREREKLLARDIHNASAHVSTPGFVRVEHRGPRLWILHVPFYTDIEDDDFVESVKGEIEKIWRLRDGQDEFRVELSVSYIPAGLLYTGRQPPQKGDKIHTYKHLDLFPLDGAILTTGALMTHVYKRAIVLGPHNIAPRMLAHEFGHILGFRDVYFRGYKDLGKNGFQVMEVVADPNDIMGAPHTGRVLRAHFERILERSREPKRFTGHDESVEKKTV